MAILPELIVDSNFWVGLILGFQEDNTDTTSQCFDSFNAIYTLIVNSNLAFGLYAATAAFKGSTATDLGYILHLFGIA